MKNGTIVALGMFDGVHMGHRKLLETTVKVAKRTNLTPIVYTFENHPAGLFGNEPKNLLSREESFRRIRSMGIGIVEVDKFDRIMCETEPMVFIDMLRRRFDMRGAIVGFNYTFGRGAGANASDLCAYGRENGLFVEVIPGVTYDGELVSSTAIRRYIEEGNIERANGMLCVPYSIEGQIVEGRRIGSLIGFPTANLRIDDYTRITLPRNGVYVTLSYVDGEGCAYRSVTNIGTNPTVGGASISVEAHLLGFAQDIYGKSIRVEFLHRIRDQIKFTDTDALAMQIGRDVEAAINYFNNEFRLDSEPLIVLL